MIQAFLNSQELKLYPKIAIGLTIENFNISDMSNRKIDRTNVIQVPKSGNEKIFDFSSAPNAPSDFPYNDFDFDMTVDGVIIYENGRAFIVGDDDISYTLQITNNKNIIDLLKSISLADLYSGDTVNYVTTGNPEDAFGVKTNGFRIDYTFENGITPTVDTYGHAHGDGYLSIYLDTILDKIEADHSISFSGDLLSDSDFQEMRIPCTQSNLKRNNADVNIYISDLIINESATAWDLIKNVLQLFCAVFKIEGTNMELQKFGDLDSATPIDWSGKLVSKRKLFAIPGTAQKNYIRYSVAENVDKNEFVAEINCNNENLDFDKVLASMKAKIYPLRDVQLYYTNRSTTPLNVFDMPEIHADFPGLPGDPDPSPVIGNKDLMFWVDSDEFLGQPLTYNLANLFDTTGGGSWSNEIHNGSITSDAFTLLPKYYDPTPNYSLIETMLTDPVFYEAELNLNIIDIHDFDHFKAAKIDELEGIFYVNIIDNFLATSPGTPTKVELIKIS